MRDQFLINLKRFAINEVPAATPDDAKLLRVQVQEALRKVQTLPASRWEYSTVKPEGIAKTEAVWEKVEEAWVEFTQAAFPSLTADQVQAQLDRLRLHQLQSMVRS